MKCFIAFSTIAGLSAISTSAFQVPFATRAVVPKKKVVAREAVAKKEIAKKVKVAPKVAPKKVVAKATSKPKKNIVKKVSPGAKKALIKKKTAAKTVKKTPQAKKGPPESRGYPMLNLNFRFKKISGGGNKGPKVEFKIPDFSDPKLQIKRDPAFYAAAAKTRFADKNVFDYDDGLTVLERNQRKSSQKTFLTGGANSQIDEAAIRDDIDPEVLNSLFGLDPDRFQLLFISIFGLFTLVGCLSGNLKI